MISLVFYPYPSEPSTNFKNFKLAYFKMAMLRCLIKFWFHNKSFCPLSLGPKWLLTITLLKVHFMLIELAQLFSKHRFLRGGVQESLNRPFCWLRKIWKVWQRAREKALYGWAKWIFSNHAIKWYKVAIITKILWALRVIRNSEIDEISAGTFIYSVVIYACLLLRREGFIQ